MSYALDFRRFDDFKGGHLHNAIPVDEARLDSVIERISLAPKGNVVWILTEDGRIDEESHRHLDLLQAKFGLEWRLVPGGMKRARAKGLPMEVEEGGAWPYFMGFSFLFFSLAGILIAILIRE